MDNLSQGRYARAVYSFTKERFELGNRVRHHKYMKVAALGMFLFFGLFPVLAHADISGRASVIDGDTIEIRGQRIRLWGIDAPEGRQTCERNGQAWRCGQAASFALADKIGSRPINCKQRDKDRYRRIVAVCFLTSEDLNGWMVRQGWALDYQQYSKGRYKAEENEARRNGRGIWTAKFLKPWEWRRKSRKSSYMKWHEGVMRTTVEPASLAAISAPFFRDLVRPSSPNNWLIGPVGFPGNPDEVAPVFPLPAGKLAKSVRGMISHTKNVTNIRGENLFLCFVVETEFFHFKDDVCIQIISLTNDSSTIAAYSASRAGYWDFGVNKKRLRQFVDKLKITKV